MNLDRLLNPQSIAIVGASANPQKASGMLLTFMRKAGYEGRVYPVNPNYEQIQDWRCYPNVEALPEAVDLIVLVVPVAAAQTALEAAAARGVPFAVLTTGGYGEGMTGEEGERRSDQLVALCRRTGLRILGPNIIGFVNFRRKLPLVFADWYARDTGQRGGIAIITHSGSVGGLIFSSLQLNKIGVDYWIATGNEATLETADIIAHLSEDPALHTIVCFMEGVMNGRHFMAAAEKARAAGKNLVVLKAGASPDSALATKAHTRKQSSSGDVYEGVLRQLGVIQAASLPELVQIVRLLGIPGARTRGRVGLMAASGGSCSLFSDYFARAGLSMPELPASVQKKLASIIPEYGSVRNPVDLTADIISRPEILNGALDAIEKDDTVDTWMIFGRPICDRYHELIRAYAKRSGKKIVILTGVPPNPDVERALQADGIMSVEDPELCGRALGAIARISNAGTGVPTDWMRHPPRRVRQGQPTDAAALLQRFGLPSAAAKLPNDQSSQPLVAVRIFQDGDFGPLLAIGDPAGPDHRRVVRAIPVAAAGLRSALDELAAHGVDSASADPDRMTAVLERSLELYAAERSVAEMAFTLAAESGSLIARDAVVRTVAEPRPT